MGGWLRLGLVVTALWVVGTFLAAMWLEVSGDRASVEAMHALCLEMLGAENFQKCADSKNAYRAELAAIPPNWTSVAILSLGPILPFWLSGWSAISIGRWIRRGFARGSVSRAA